MRQMVVDIEGKEASDAALAAVTLTAFEPT